MLANFCFSDNPCAMNDLQVQFTLFKEKNCALNVYCTLPAVAAAYVRTEQDITNNYQVYMTSRYN